MRHKNHYFFLVVVTLMMSVNLLATDIYLPALPEMVTFFNCSHTDIQQSFTIFLLGLATCQLLAGMLSDHFGRKKVVVIGFIIFTLASFLCSFTSTLGELLICRLFQAVGGGVGSVVGRALIVDKFNRQESVKIFSTVFPIIGLSSAVAPLIGGYLTTFWGWRSNFFFIGGFGLVILSMALLCLKGNKFSKPHVSPEERIGNSLTARLQGYMSVIRNPEFLSFAFIICAGFSVFRSYTVESPFVFNNQGFGAEEIGHFYIALSLAYLIGNLTARKLSNSLNISQLLAIGFSFFVLGGLCMLTSSYLFSASPYSIIAPMAIITTGNGFLFPVASAGALTAVSSKYAGTASGLMGAMQFVFAALCINWIGDFSQGQALKMALFIGTIILLGLGNFILLVVYKPKTPVTAA